MIGLSKQVLINVFFVLLFGLNACSKSEPMQPVPELGKFIPKSGEMNVLVISFDSLRADALGAYGYHRNTSPNIDSFAQKSVVFDQAHSAGATTPTSFASAFSGKLPFYSLIGLKLVGPTIASTFKDAGYRTGFISNNLQLVAKRNFSQGYEHYQIIITESNHDEKVRDESFKLLEEFRNDRFFVWLHFLQPHVPYELRPLSAHLVDPDYEGPYRESSGVHWESNITSEDDLKRLRDLYDGEVFFADSIFRAIWDKCKQLGLMDNTIIVLTSDHGEEFLEHGGFGHQTVYEEGIKIPLIIRHPKSLGAGRINTPYLNIDLFPTLAGMVGLSYPKVGGMNLLTENTNIDRSKISAHMVPPSNQVEISLRKGSKKMMMLCEDEKKLVFDLNEDPVELINIANDVEEELAEMSSELIGEMGIDPCQTIENAKRGVTAETGMDSDEIRILKSLGYVQ